jgi:uncharacterized protein (TIGR02453 family)
MDKLVLDFLRNLKLNNNREWFNEHKKQYEAARQEVEKFVDFLMPNLKKIDSKIGTITAKQALFRIYRDVRFSKDKSPYKTNFGAYISPGGKKSNMAGYYIHFDPEGSFIAGGSYGPNGEILKKIRAEIYYNLDEFTAILNKKIFKETFGELSGEKLVRPPQGFPTDIEGIEYLKFKDFTVFRHVTEKEVLKPEFGQVVLDTFKTLKPLNDFLNKAIFG